MATDTSFSNMLNEYHPYPAKTKSTKEKPMPKSKWDHMADMKKHKEMMLKDHKSGTKEY